MTVHSTVGSRGTTFVRSTNTCNHHRNHNPTSNSRRVSGLSTPIITRNRGYGGNQIPGTGYTVSRPVRTYTPVRGFAATVGSV